MRKGLLQPYPVEDFYLGFDPNFTHQDVFVFSTVVSGVSFTDEIQPQSKNMYVELIGDCKMLPVVRVRVNGVCPCVCVCVMEISFWVR